MSWILYYYILVIWRGLVFFTPIGAAAQPGAQGSQDYTQQWMDYFQQQALYMNQQQGQGQTPAQVSAP